MAAALKYDANEHWSLDKRVPIALILALLAQFAAAIWAVADIKADVGELQRADIRIIESVREQRTRIDAVDRERNNAEMRLIRVEEQTKQIYDAIRDLSTTVRRSLEKSDEPAVMVPTPVLPNGRR